MLIYSWFRDNPYLTILTAITALFILINLIVIWRFRIAQGHLRTYEQLLKDCKGAELLESMQYLSQKQKEYHSELELLEQKIARIEAGLPLILNRLAMIRYKGFSDVGGDLSFSLALLSEEGDGVVLTGLYGREETRLWAKPVQKFSSTYPLSQEEQEVLKTAETR